MKVAVADEHDDVGFLVGLINRVYTESEYGVWRDGYERTNADEVAQFIKSRELLVARDGQAVIGALRVRRLADQLAEFGMLVAEPAHRGTGVGRRLVAHAEQWARDQDLRTMQLELLVPRAWTHPVKEFLNDWYTRIGYRKLRTTQLEEAYPALQPFLATESDFVIYHKDLR
ncbi:GNAT family N-acetyltransferase [Micromonospora azadirachtae]|uniref:GNAT family N-acetyltransferase n=1 Tax=Micromonospora azadirachtae TaxID=1970735 RepID=A0ABW2ZV39_9ACTN